MLRCPLIPLGAFALALCATSAPAAAAETPPSEVRAPTVIWRADLGSSKRPERDVHLSVRGDDAAVLFVHGGRLHELPYDEWTKYAVRPTSASGDGFAAEFEAVGVVSLRFRPSGEVKLGRNPEGCAGRRPRREAGTYRGSIALGEGRYFRLHRSVARGVRVRTFALRCGSGSAAPAPAGAPLGTYVAPRLTPEAGVRGYLETFSEDGGVTAGFDARSGSGTIEYGESGVVETRARMAVGHYTFFGAPLVLNISSAGPGLLTATVLGAAYNSDPSQPETWNGPLNAELPGGRDVLVNGPDSRTRLCVGRSPTTPAECVGDPAPVLSGGPFDPPAFGDR